MKRFFLVVIVLCLFSSISSNAQNIEEPRDLYALSAVLMDAETGCILFAKNGEEVRAMASTTKIMTCILTLESGKEDEVVTVSEKAAGQP